MTWLVTVFPILSSKQTDIGPIITLHSALAEHLAEVRELGPDEVSRPEPTREDGAVRQRAQLLRQHARLVGQSRGARVNTLVIENKGDVPIYVLAGTVVKGGNQDRQIAQDFLVAARTTVPIDAFCVEHGRWSSDRQGQPTPPSSQPEAIL